MKVFSLYHHNKFVASFPTREEVVAYGKSNGGDAWDYDVIEEYLSKSPITYNPPYTSLTPSQTIPCRTILDTGITVLPGTPKTNPGTYPDIYCDGRWKSESK
jgi:hypothetical protein